MRVLQIVPSLSLVYGGPSQMVLGLSAALAQAGVTVTVLTTDSNGDFAGTTPLDVPLAVPVAQNGYEVIYFRCSPFRRYKFSLELLQWLKVHAHEYDVAHIHALFSPVSTAAARVARQVGLPYILRPLGTLDPADLRKKKLLKQVYAALWERANLAGAAAIHFTSDQEAKVSDRFGAITRDVVLPLGVSLPEPLPEPGYARSQLNLPEAVPLVLFLSRIEPKKGLDLLLPALEALLQAGEQFHFVLAGANPQDPAYEASIRARIAASPLATHTTFTGFIQGSLKAALLQDVDLFVLPSYYENFGIAVAEGMAAGLPVVISDQVHIARNIAEAGAGWVVPCEVNALREALQEAIRDPQQRQLRGAQGKQYAQEHYTWASIARQVMQVYDSLRLRKAAKP
ncbi:glycosyltransferase [Leptolyngbya sp. FACHB-261]|nr:glycosyltransferase [Leptolyngbya sp. FACHB-261]